MLVDFATARSQLTTPAIKAIAIASPDSFPGLPSVPTIAGKAATGTPADIVARLRDAYLAAIQDSDVMIKLADAGIDILQSTPAAFADYMRSETANGAR